jgi:hypothetical protein
MIATVPTIHKSVVFLLKKSGYGSLEAERLWDSVYSVQFQQAKPNVPHTWVIGEYSIEFTKRTQETEPIEVTAAPDTGRGGGVIVLLLLSLIVLAVVGVIVIL